MSLEQIGRSNGPFVLEFNCYFCADARRFLTAQDPPGSILGRLPGCNHDLPADTKRQVRELVPIEGVARTRQFRRLQPVCVRPQAVTKPVPSRVPLTVI